mmetsp:Transcript_68441/g.135241  ORF Transcript_68441/g.135241 Transcript_68441/m.135241 type:complete len:226 (-) Transcript_68441:47-724(-)
MLVPIGFQEGPPTAFQLKMKPTLTALVSLQVAIAVCRMVSGDILGALSDAMVAAMGCLAIMENSIMYITFYGLACALNCAFDMTQFVMRLATLKSSYFDLGRSLLFNLASFSILAAAVTALLAAAISLAIWRDHQQQSTEGIPLYGQYPQAAGGFVPPPSAAAAGNYYGSAFGGPGPQQAPGSVGSFSAFAGAGHRLGHDSVESLPASPQAGWGRGRMAPPERHW